MKSWICLLLCSLLCAVNLINAQSVDSQNYPQHYFRNPLGIPMELVANFGEVRSEHFHMGLDIRTDQKENLSVYAAAAGYVSRVKIERFGFGRSIFITHPNGFTTVYAHLNDFFQPLDSVVKAKQYKEESWEQDVIFKPGIFPVFKGEFIALSGNTGGSQGPHLHFEIRDTKSGKNINPLFFGLPVTDHLAPETFKLFYYDRTESIYLNDAREIKIIQRRKRDETVDSVVEMNTSKFSFAIWSEDKSDNSPFKYGIYEAGILLDDSLRCSFKLNSMDYDNTRYVNACIDYGEWLEHKHPVQHLSKLPGNKSAVFANDSGDGVLVVNDTLIHNACIFVKDVFGNADSLYFRIHCTSSLNEKRKDRITLSPNQKNTIEEKGIKLSFDEAAFYDTIPLKIISRKSESPNAVSSSFTICCDGIPVHTDFDVAIVADEKIDTSLSSKIIMRLNNNHSFEGKQVQWNTDTAHVSFNRLGTLQLMIDTVPPKIKPIGWSDSCHFANETEIKLEVKDGLTSIRKFGATLDGDWLMFSRKNDEYVYHFDNHCSLGWHNLHVIAEDECGNIVEEHFTFDKELPRPTKKPKSKKRKQSAKKSKANVRRRK